MASIRINTVSNGPTIIGLNAGSTYEIDSSTNFAKTVIAEKDSAGTTVSLITINKYVAENADDLWPECNKTAYELIANSPANFGYPTFAGASADDYRDLDLSSPMADIIAGAMGNDLPAVYSEWLSFIDDTDKKQRFDDAIATAEAEAVSAKTACEEATVGCPGAGYYYDPISGLQCDCNSNGGSPAICCEDVKNTILSDLTASAVEAVGMTKKHIYLFDSVTVGAPPNEEEGGA